MIGLRNKQTVDVSIEKRILTGIIVSDKVIHNLIPFLKPEFLELSLSQKIARWVNDFYTVYKVSPKNHITDLYLTEKPHLKMTEIDELEAFLKKLSEEYLIDGTNVNEDYVINQGKQYLLKQQMIKVSKKIQELAEGNQLKEASELYGKLKTYTKESQSKWVDPFDPSLLPDLFSEEISLFKFDGRFGELIGPLRRGWLFGVMGPMKRGKSWILQNISIHCLFSKKRVLFVTLEMNKEDIIRRFYQQVGAFGLAEKEYTYPTFDCYYNQMDKCKRPERVSKIGKPIEFDPKSHYRPCSVCRGTSDYSTSYWFTSEFRPELTRKKALKKAKQIHQSFGKNRIKVLDFPAYSACLSDIMGQVDLLEISEGFIPDVIVIDYADILAPEFRTRDEREMITTTWKTLKRIAQERNCLVVTASQSNRDSFGKALIHEKHTAEDIRKLAEVDLMITLNQTEKEHSDGVMRISTLVHRWKEFDKYRQVIILQQLHLGQPMLDSEYYNPKRRETEDEEI